MKSNECTVVTCPERHETKSGRVSIFLAGGITNCPDWQSEILQTPLAREPVDLLNPRRPALDVSDESKFVEQIAWEAEHLRKADAILFWFCADQIQPIALFELGYWLRSEKPLFIGVNPRYPRRLDVIEQVRHARPDLRVCTEGLAALTWDVERWLFERDGAK